MEDRHRIKAKIGPHEFEAEGKEAIVIKQYDSFLAAVKAMASAPQSHDAGAKLAPEQSKLRPDAAIPKDVLARVFRDGDPLSLMHPPKTDKADADGLLMLIYGYTEMMGKPDVTAATLALAARKTGLKVDRLSRSLAAHEALIGVSGAKKGTRYTLNNRGIAEAKRLILSSVE
jgi:hypothetical protein